MGWGGGGELEDNCFRQRQSVRNLTVSWYILTRGSMQALQHRVIYSPERNQLSHNGLRCLHIIYLNIMLSKHTHNVLTLLAADSAVSRLELA